jgi:hypothetical protein
MQDDEREQIKLSSFGFVPGGYLHVNVSLTFTAATSNEDKDQNPKVQVVLQYLDRIEFNCRLLYY